MGMKPVGFVPIFFAHKCHVGYCCVVSEKCLSLWRLNLSKHFNMKTISRFVCSTVAVLLCLFASAAVTNPQPVSDLLNRVGGQGTADRFVTVLDETLSATAGTEVFVISSSEGKPCIKGSTLSALTTGIGWYLNHYANVNVSWNNLNPDLTTINLPAPVGEETHETNAQYRHYLNYCTFSYSMSTWTWERWQQEIDWMALHGINAPLHIIGLEEVWRKMLIEDYGYSTAEANAFIAGPCFMAWFGMNNLEGHGGPNPDWWYARQAELGKKMTQRMNELGIEPVLPGFAGMVPTNFTRKTGIASVGQGGWVNGFTRPNILTPATDGFTGVAANYYKRLEEVMGTSAYYSMDPFHEGGGSTGGVDAKLAYSSIYECLAEAQPEAKWFIQQWQWAGGQWQSVANGVIPQGKLIVLDLYSDGKAGSQLNSYNGHETVYCMIPNFGARTGFFGRITTLIDSYFNNRSLSSLKGIAAVPEGIEQVPIIYDLCYEMPWMSTKPDAQKWVADYVKRRYGGVESPEAVAAWELLRTSALDCKTGLQGPHEAIMCAIPSLSINAVSAWGSSEIFYDVNSTYSAAYKLLEANLTGENYSYDLVDVSRQALTDYSKTLLAGIKEAHADGNTELFEMRRDAFLQLILDIDQLLNTNKDFMVGHWTERARAIADEAEGTTEADREWLELNNARTLITTWANTDGNLRDYSYRQWGGIMKDLYYDRWKRWFDNNMGNINAWQISRNWAMDASKRYPTTPIGNTAEVAATMLPKYLSPLTSQVDLQGTRYIQRLLVTDLKGQFFDRAKRGEVYAPDFNIAGTSISEIAIDLNRNTLFGDDEVFTAENAIIPADAAIGEYSVRIKLADGTQVTYTIAVTEEIIEPRTVSVATEDESKGTVSIDGTESLSITNTDFVKVRAHASARYDFDHWLDQNGNNLGNDNPMTYYGKESVTLTAYFAESKWGVPNLDMSDHQAIIDNKQWIPSFSLTQHGETEEIYSAPTMPEDHFIVVPSRIKAAPGGDFSISWNGNAGLSYLYLSAWADFDNDGTFETILATKGTKNAQNASMATGEVNIVIPFEAVKGTTHIRFRFDSAWNSEIAATGQPVAATAATNRMIYDFLLELNDSPVKPSTVTASVNDSSLGYLRTENMANIYVSGEDVIITAFPNQNARFVKFVDNHGRDLPSEWVDGNKASFKVYGDAHITAILEPSPLVVDGWEFNLGRNYDGSFRIESVATPGKSTLDLSNVQVRDIKPEVFSGRDDIFEITLPAVVLKTDGKVITDNTVVGSGATNQSVTPARTIKGNETWVLYLTGETGTETYNEWGTPLFANGTNATADDYSGGWSQFYLKKNGILVVKWDSAEENLFSDVPLSGKFTIRAEFNGSKSLTVTVTNSSGMTQTKTIANSSTMRDISQFVSCAPNGMTLNFLFTKPESDVKLGTLFVGTSWLENIHLAGPTENNVEINGVIYNKTGKKVVAYPEGRLRHPFYLLKNDKPVYADPLMEQLTRTYSEKAVSNAEVSNKYMSLWRFDGENLVHINSHLQLNANANEVTESGAQFSLSLVYGTGMPTLKLTSGSNTHTFDFEELKKITVTEFPTLVSHPFSVSIPNGVAAFYIDAVDINGVRLTACPTEAALPGGLPVIITESDVPVMLSYDQFYFDVFYGVAYSTYSRCVADRTVYVAEDSDFVRHEAGFIIPANTACIDADTVPTSIGDRFSIFSQMSIVEIESPETAPILYDTTGRRVDSNPSPGVYVTSEGEKIIIRK
ncbi:MAG: alpha-N-acetylglucosaminidase [Bacteroidales bacterium]|nr:alpha-N-acetylglucosaminidase [Bacteroidales bacterium]